MPIRGHSNVQGIGSVGVDAAAQAGHARAVRAASRRAAADVAGAGHDGLHGGRRPRRDAKSALCLGGNLFGSNPDATFAAQALGEARSDRVPEHDAQYRARLGPGEGNADPARAASRRGAAADDAGVDVQLRAAERRRAGAAPGTAKRSVGAADARPPGARRQRPGQLARPRKPRAHPRADRRADSRASSRWPTSTGRASEFHIAGRRLDTPQFPTAIGQGAVSRDRRCRQRRHGARAPAAADDRALGGAVQHRRLRGGGHLPRAGAARRHPDEPARHAATGPARRSAGHRAQLGWRNAPAAACGRSTSARATRRCITPKRTCSCRATSIRGRRRRRSSPCSWRLFPSQLDRTAFACRSAFHLSASGRNRRPS